MVASSVGIGVLSGNVGVGVAPALQAKEAAKANPAKPAYNGLKDFPKPIATAYAIMYKLKILARLVKERHGFDMFVFEKTLDFDAKKEVKMMKLNTAMSITDIEGNVFVEFTKSL